MLGLSGECDCVRECVHFGWFLGGLCLYDGRQGSVIA